MDVDENIRISLPKGDEMKKLIECPVCLDIPLPPIFLCRRGHIVCNFCQEHTQVCPLCRDSYTTTRSFVAEGIVEQCLMKCKYREQGCPAVLKGGELAVHLRTCNYRPYRCSECNGKWIMYGDYWGHLIGVHRINGVNQSHAQVLYNLDFGDQLFTGYNEGTAFCWPPYYFKCFNGKTFLLKVRIHQKNICAFVSFLGPVEAVDNFRARIEFASVKGFSVTWEGRMNHFRDDGILDVIHKGRGLIQPLELIENNSTSDSVAGMIQSWSYRVKISMVGQDANTNNAAVNGLPYIP